jgi:hypothetical protein
MSSLQELVNTIANGAGHLEDGNSNLGTIAARFFSLILKSISPMAVCPKKVSGTLEAPRKALPIKGVWNLPPVPWTIVKR